MTIAAERAVVPGEAALTPRASTGASPAATSRWDLQSWRGCCARLEPSLRRLLRAGGWSPALSLA